MLMPDRVCSCCGQTLPPKLDVGIYLTQLQQRLVERVHRAGKHGIQTSRLFDFMYGDDPNGGPSHGNDSLRVFIYQVNQRLKKVGKVIRSPKGGRGCEGIYTLRDLP